MPTKRCPNCQALNAGDARRCSLCGQSMARETEAPAPTEARPAATQAEATDADRGAAPTPPAAAAPEASHYAPGPGPRRGVRAATGAAMGAGVAAVLVVVTYALFYALRVLPFVGYGMEFLQPLAIFAAGPAPVLSSIAVAVVLGAIVGAFATVRDTPWAGAVLFGALAVAFRIISVLARNLVREYGGFGVVYGAALTVVDGTFGAVYGYIVSLVVCGYLAATRTRPSD